MYRCSPVTEYSLVICVALSLAVICCPSVFYFSTIDEHTMGELQVIHDEVTLLNSIDGPLHDAQLAFQMEDQRLASVRSQMPWGTPTQEQQYALQHAQRKHTQAHTQLVEMRQAKENALSRARYLTPIWSELAFQESRELWYERMNAYKESAKRVAKWDVLFQTLGSSRDESAMNFLLRAAISVFWRLITFGAMSLFDFCARLPFYLKEYSPESSRAATYAFYALNVLGAIGATLLYYCVVVGCFAAVFGALFFLAKTFGGPIQQRNGQYQRRPQQFMSHNMHGQQPRQQQRRPDPNHMD
jgi:hypothetical protein